MNINKVPLDCCRHELQKQGLNPVTDEMLAKVIQSDDDLVAQLNDRYKGNDEQGLDTFERDWLFEVVAQHFTGRSWPCNMDTANQAKEFAKRLVEGTTKAGWK